MRATKIPEQEQKFAVNFKNTSNVQYKLEAMTNLPHSTINHIRPNFDSYYYPTEFPKKKIVLHYTVGTIRGDMASLTKKDNHMSVSYVINRKGDIYELFDPKYWSYHLGRGSVGGNGYGSKESIGIELSNYGPLKKVGDNLETMYSQVSYTGKDGKPRRTKRDIYCSLDETEYYDKVFPALRGNEYFASFTKNQLLATRELVHYLCKFHNIPENILDEDVRYKPFTNSQEAKDFSGICSHINFRKSGKWDIGSHFPWDTLKGIKLEKSKTPVVEVPVVEADTPGVIYVDTPPVVMQKIITDKPNWMGLISKALTRMFKLLKRK